MLLRKPYAFLIKHFKLIHIIIEALMIYLLYRSVIITDFFNSYIEVLKISNKVNLVSSLYKPIMYIIPIIIVLLLISILAMMVSKKKPVKYYIFNIIIYASLLIFYILSRKVVYNLEISIVDIRVVKIYRDLFIIFIVIQVISNIFTLVRATGFDIKKFDFVKDLEELELTEEDNEKFELDVSFNSNKARRKINKFFRQLKYLYKENKFIIISGLIIVFCLISLGIYRLYDTNFKVYKEGVTASEGSISLRVNKSYITKTNYKNAAIDDEKIYAVISISTSSNNKSFLNLGSLSLEVGDHYIYPLEPNNNMLDIGNIYTETKLDTVLNDYIVVFELPNNLEDYKMYLNYSGNNEKLRYKLNLVNIDSNKSEVDASLTEEVDLSDSIFGSGKFSIASYEIKDKFKIEYDFCLEKDCQKSIEYLVPTLSNYDKSILKLNGALMDVNNSNFDTFPEFVNKLGKIVYVKDSKKYTSRLSLKILTSKKSNLKDTYYFEVEKKVSEADSIYLVINIRNIQYNYKIK